MITVVYEYLSTLYPPDHNVMQHAGGVQPSLSWVSYHRHKTRYIANLLFYQRPLLTANLPIFNKPPCPAGTTKHENMIVPGVHFQFNILESEATSLLDVGRSMLDVHFHIKAIPVWLPDLISMSIMEKTQIRLFFSSDSTTSFYK